MNNISIFLSLLPFLIFIYLLFIRKTSLINASVAILGLYTLLAIFYWKIIPYFLYVSFGKGFFVALDIFIIILGAVFFLEIIQFAFIIYNFKKKYPNFVLSEK